MSPVNQSTQAIYLVLNRLITLVTSAKAELRSISKGEKATTDDNPALLERISEWLYSHWYSVPEPAISEITPTLGRNSLSSALRSCMPSLHDWHTEWVVMQSWPNGNCLAGHDKAARELRVGEYANLSRPAMPVMPGDHIAVSGLIAWVDDKTGFWCAQSPYGEPKHPLVRLYLSVSNQQVGFVLNLVTAALNAQKFKYLLKCPSQEANYTRVDSLIYYIEAKDWARIEQFSLEIADKIQPFLRESTPPLTYKIAPGIALAEDPGSNVSFGQKQCRALASGVLQLIDGESRANSDSLAILMAALQSQNTNPTSPWRN